MEEPPDVDGGHAAVDNGAQSSAISTSPERKLMEIATTTINSWDTYDTVFLNSKAGMDGVDKKKVQKVVYEMSKGSRYFNNEQRKEAAVLHRIQCMRSQAASLTPGQIAEHERTTAMKIAELEGSRDLSRVWLHVDMDAFYAAVETLENPSLAEKPMAVGDMSMICTANYEARKFGVRAAMPGFIARKLCPDLIFVRPNFQKYSNYSEKSRKVFREFDPNFISRSMDEAYLDITDACRLRSLTPAEVAQELRCRVHQETQLTCSAGVGPNRLLAKVCSDINKPNGQFILSNDRARVMAFISSLPIRKISGVGKVTERLLKDALGICICQDLIKNRSMISALFSKVSTDFFMAVGLGIGGSEASQEESRKSLSNERTFPAISEKGALFRKLDELAEALAADMQKEELQGRTLTLKLKTTGFEVRSRAVTLPVFIYSKADIVAHASKLLRRELPLSLRLMGLRISHFKDEKPDSGELCQKSITNFISSSGSANCLKGSHEVVESGRDFSGGMESDWNPVEGLDQCLLGDTTASKINLSCDTESDGFRPNPKIFSGSQVHEIQVLVSPKKSPGKQGESRQLKLDTFMEQTSNSNVRQDEQTKFSDLGLRIEAFGKDTSYYEDEGFLITNSVMSSNASEELIIEIQKHSSFNKFHGTDTRGGEHNFLAGIPGVTKSEHHQSPDLGNDIFSTGIWNMGGRCCLCDVKVSDELILARQEHEDYHFAIMLQQQAENSMVLPKPSSRVLEKGQERSGGTYRKRSRHLPLEAFFSKATSEN